jgi:hypothetical protein
MECHEIDCPCVSHELATWCWCRPLEAAEVPIQARQIQEFIICFVPIHVICVVIAMLAKLPALDGAQATHHQ